MNTLYAMDGGNRKRTSSKVNSVNDFTVTFDKVKKEVAKRKGWTALGIDGIQNYWWKKFESAKKHSPS